MMIFNHFTGQLLMLPFRFKALKLYLEDSVCLSAEHRTTIEQPNSNGCVPRNGQAFVKFHPVAKNDRVLFSTWKLSISAKSGHCFGLDVGKIKACRVKMETRCPLTLAVFFNS